VEFLGCFGDRLVVGILRGLLERQKGKKIFPTNVLASEEPWVARVGLRVEVFESMIDSLLDIQR
jgi:hypothetical protein